MAYIRRLSSRVSSFSDFLFVNFYSRHEYSFNYCSLDILIRWRSSWMLDHIIQSQMAVILDVRSYVFIIQSRNKY
jgi:hypothetical protein